MTSPAVDRYATMEKTKTTIAGPLGLGVNGVEAPRTSEPSCFDAWIIQEREEGSQGLRNAERGMRSAE